MPTPPPSAPGYRRVLPVLLGSLGIWGTAHGQLILSSADIPVSLDFTTPLSGVVAGSPFGATTLPSPDPTDTLDTEAWSAMHLGAGTAMKWDFGGVATGAGSNRGTKTGSTLGGGLYSFVDAAGTNHALGVHQAAYLNNLTLTLKVVNQTGATLPGLHVEYDVFAGLHADSFLDTSTLPEVRLSLWGATSYTYAAFNDLDRSAANNTVRGGFGYHVEANDFTSTLATSKVVLDPANPTAHLSQDFPVTLENGATFYLQWRFDTLDGLAAPSNTDALALDNLSVGAVPEPAIFALGLGLGGLLWAVRRPPLCHDDAARSRSRSIPRTASRRPKAPAPLP